MRPCLYFVITGGSNFGASPFETARSAPPQGEDSGHIMKPFLGNMLDSRRVYLAIKFAVLALAILLALHFLFGVV